MKTSEHHQTEKQPRTGDAKDDDMVIGARTSFAGQWKNPINVRGLTSQNVHKPIQ
jgi:hypothetical protein